MMRHQFQLCTYLKFLGFGVEGFQVFAHGRRLASILTQTPGRPAEVAMHGPEDTRLVGAIEDYNRYHDGVFCLVRWGVQ